MHKKRFYVCVRSNHSEFEGQIKVVFIENMTNNFINYKSCRNRKFCVNVQQKYRKKVILAAIFCFAYLKTKDIKRRIVSDRFEFSTPKLCNKTEKKSAHKC